jgi:hypothetical protein
MFWLVLAAAPGKNKNTTNDAISSDRHGGGSGPDEKSHPGGWLLTGLKPDGA